jgi:histidine triad (HIT) family protein
VNDISEVDKELVGHMFQVAAQIAADQGIAESGYRILVNCNADAGQEIFHLHMHLLGGRNLGPMLA